MGELIRSDFLMIFGAEKSNLKKITYRGGLGPIVLNPFLDFLCNFGFKNIGLTPGTGSGFFHSSQDVVTDAINRNNYRRNDTFARKVICVSKSTLVVANVANTVGKITYIYIHNYLYLLILKISMYIHTMAI